VVFDNLPTPMTTNVACVAICTALLGFSCKAPTPIEKARAALSSEPSRSLELVEPILKQTPNDYPAVVVSARAHHLLGNSASAEVFYERAIAIANGRKLVDDVRMFRGQLLELFHATITARGEAQEPYDTKWLHKVNGLERLLRRQNALAGRTLFALQRAAFSDAMQKENFDGALAALDGIKALYAPTSDKRSVLAKQPLVLASRFRWAWQRAFDAGPRQSLVKVGAYDEKMRTLVFESRYEIEVQVSDAPDPGERRFAQLMRQAACRKAPSVTAFSASLDATVRGPPLGRKLSRNEWWFAMRQVLTKPTVRWDGAAWDITKAYKSGDKLALVCRRMIPIDTVIAVLYDLSLRPLAK
jgi:hypothetical protein